MLSYSISFQFNGTFGVDFYHLPLRTEVPRTAPFGPIAVPETLVAVRPLGPVTVVLTPAAAPLGPTATPAVLATIAEPVLYGIYKL